MAPHDEAKQFNMKEISNATTIGPESDDDSEVDDTTRQMELLRSPSDIGNNGYVVYIHHCTICVLVFLTIVYVCRYEE